MRLVEWTLDWIVGAKVGTPAIVGLVLVRTVQVFIVAILALFLFGPFFEKRYDNPQCRGHIDFHPQVGVTCVEGPPIP